jgi:hypothetical protein
MVQSGISLLLSSEGIREHAEPVIIHGLKATPFELVNRYVPP